MINLIERFPCISITQPIGTFYVAQLPAKVLLSKTNIERRGLTPEERQNVQRRLNQTRKVEIAEYVERDNATFPTSIIVAANSDNLKYDPETSELIMAKDLEEPTNQAGHTTLTPLDSGDFIGLVIDGQHRIEGLKKAAEDLGESILDKYQIPVVFMFDMTLEDMAEVFRTINSKQRPVDPSLIIDLFGLSRKRSPRRLCHTLAIGFNDEDGSPLKNGLKMLGKRENKTEFLSQGSFAKYVLSLISKTPDDDELNLMKHIRPKPDSRIPLRSYFIDEDDEFIGNVLWDYFSAVQKNFPLEWDLEPQNHLLRKTVGFSALIKVFT